MTSAAHAVLLLSPDFGYHGDAGFLFGLLDELGLTVELAMPVRIAPPDVTALYQGRVTHTARQRDSNSIWLSRRLHDLGNSLFLVLRDERSPGLQSRLASLKGSSVRGEARPGSLRAMSPLVDRCFSLIHTPDDDEGLREDLAIVIGRDFSRIAFEPRAPLPRECLERLVPDYRARGTHPLSVLIDLAARCLAMICADPWGERELAAAALEDVARVRGGLETSDPGLPPETVIARMDGIAETFERLAGRRADTLDIRAQFSVEMRRLLARSAARLFGASRIDARMMNDLLRILDANDCSATGWESQRLLCIAGIR